MFIDQRREKHRTPSGVRCLFVVLISLAIVTSSISVYSQDRLNRDNSLPFELTFDQRSLSTDRVSASSDGKWVAYTIFAPPDGGIRDQPLLPNGAPQYAVGKTIRVSDVATGQTLTVGPSGSDCWRPTFSTDGHQLAFYCDAGGLVHLWVYDLPSRKTRQLGSAIIRTSAWRGDEPIWNPTDTEIFARCVVESKAAALPALASGKPLVTVKKAGEELVSKASSPQATPNDAQNKFSLAAISVATGTIRTIVSTESLPLPRFPQLSHSGEWLAYDSPSGTDLAVVSTNGGKPRLVTSAISRSRGANSIFVAASWHPSRDQLFWIERRRLWMLDLSKPDAVPREMTPTIVDATLSPIAFTEDEKFVIVGTHSFEIDDFTDPAPQSVAIVPLMEGIPRILEIPSGLYLQSPVRGKGAILWQPDPNTATLLCQKISTAERVVLRLDLTSGRFTTLWNGFANLEPVGSSFKQRQLLARFQDFNTPENVYEFNKDFNEKSRITEVEPRLSDIKLGHVETFESAVVQYNGKPKKVTAAILLPTGTKRGDRLPTLVVQYPGFNMSRGAISRFGGGNGGVSAPLSLFISNGYAPLLVDAPISPYSQSASADIPGNPAKDMADVVAAQVNQAISLGYTDQNRVAVVGQSAGGYSAAAIITQTNLFKAAIAISGFYDLPGWYNPETIIHRRMGTDPWGDLPRYLANSPYYQADKIHTPLLIIHGESDPTCPVVEAQKLFTALSQLNRTVQLATYRNEGHVIYEWSKVNAVDASRRMIEFLDKYLKPLPVETAH